MKTRPTVLRQFGPTQGGFVRLPGWLWACFAVAALAGILSPNPWLTLVSVLALPVLVQSSWRVGEVPILALGLAFQWLQVTLAVYWADVNGLPVRAMALSSRVDEAILLSLGGLFVLAMGVRAGMRLGRWKLRWESFRDLASAFSVPRLFGLWILANLGARLLAFLQRFSAGLRQPLGALGELHWVFFFLLALLVIQRRRGYLYLLLATAFELLAGLGFFSGFKTPLLYLFLAVLTVYAKPSLKGLAAGGAVAAVIIYLGCIWTSIKQPYREFLNQGTGQQVVLVSPQQKVVKLGELLSEWRTADLASGAEGLVNRIAYVNYFSAVLSTVPMVVPYQDGRIWRRAFENLIPRLLWPGKPFLDDSMITRRYTGIMVASAAEGTSIGIGYMAESYVDFGPYGMFVPIFLLGVLWGAIYAYFLSRPHPAVVTYAFAAVALIDVMFFETSSTKLVAGLVIRLIFLSLLLRFVMPAVERWLLLKRRPAKVWGVARGKEPIVEGR